MKSTLSKKVFQTIEKENITPKPRWHFLIKEYTIWGIGALVLIVGSLAFAVILYMLVFNDWEVYKEIDESFLSFFILSLPYFWMMLLGVFIAVADYYIRSTEKGYRYALHTTVIGVLAGNIILGTFFYSIGLGQKIDDILVEKVPVYMQMIGNRHMRWASPENGRLAGKIIDSDNSTLLLEDVSGTLWQIRIGDARIATGTMLIPEALLKIIGTKESEQLFHAHYILPGGLGPSFYHLRPSKPLYIPVAY